MVIKLESFALSTFIKICLLDSTRQVAEVHKKLNFSSGYNFYRTLNLAIDAKASRKKDDEITDILMSSSNLVERDSNQSAYDMFEKKFGSKRGLATFKKSKNFHPKGANFTIRINPSFAIETGELSEIYAIWAMKTPDLTQSGGALACFNERCGNQQPPLHKLSFNHDILGLNSIT